MTTQSTPDTPERVSSDPLPDLTSSLRSLRAEIRSLRTIVIVMGSGYCATTIGGFIALFVTD